MSTLQEIAERCRTDKANKHSYIPVYEELVGHLRDEPLDILEIGINGVNRGASARMWLEAFPNARVHGIDVQQPPTGLRNQPRYQHITGDAYSEEIFAIAARHRYDLIIDDGPHLLSTQITAVREYSTLLKDDGILVIEDVNATKYPIALDELARASMESTAFLVISGYDLRAEKGRFDDVLFVAQRVPVLPIAAVSEEPEACRDGDAEGATADQSPPAEDQPTANTSTNT